MTDSTINTLVYIAIDQVTCEQSFSKCIHRCTLSVHKTVYLSELLQYRITATEYRITATEYRITAIEYRITAYVVCMYLEIVRNTYWA